MLISQRMIAQYTVYNKLDITFQLVMSNFNLLCHIKEIFSRNFNLSYVMSYLRDGSRQLNLSRNFNLLVFFHVISICYVVLVMSYLRFNFTKFQLVIT